VHSFAAITVTVIRDLVTAQAWGVRPGYTSAGRTPSGHRSGVSGRAGGPQREAGEPIAAGRLGNMGEGAPHLTSTRQPGRPSRAALIAAGKDLSHRAACASGRRSRGGDLDPLAGLIRSQSQPSACRLYPGGNRRSYNSSSLSGAPAAGRGWRLRWPWLPPS
jgi:hypothetical protein